MAVIGKWFLFSRQAHGDIFNILKTGCDIFETIKELYC